MTTFRQEKAPAVDHAFDSENIPSSRLLAERVLLSALRAEDAAEVAEIARRRAQFLSEAGLRFGATLDLETTYGAIAGVALPGLDAWCVVDVIETSGALRRLAVLHADVTKQDAARALVGRWTASDSDPIGVPAVRRGVAPVVLLDHAAAIAAAAGNESTLRVLHQLGVGAVLVVPIVSHSVLLGAITFVSRLTDAAFSPEDLAVAEALAMRCGQALESARLYAAARAARDEANAARLEAETARAAAEAANQSKADFLGAMSHELRTPLNAIGGYAQLMEMGLRGPVTDQQRRDLSSIQRSQAHLLGLVDSVLSYAQLGSGRVVYATGPMLLIEVVESVHALIAPQMQAAGVRYLFAPGDESLTVLADAPKVRQIVLNLLANATKFTPSGGQVSVQCEWTRVGGAPVGVVRVTDTGIGIAPDQIEAVFEPFVQVDRRPSSPHIGVGLGLAVSRQLARGMHGDLTARSAPGAGSQFTLTLPLG